VRGSAKLVAESPGAVSHPEVEVFDSSQGRWMPSATNRYVWEAGRVFEIAEVP
jgi:hypothetical protein